MGKLAAFLKAAQTACPAGLREALARLAGKPQERSAQGLGEFDGCKLKDASLSFSLGSFAGTIIREILRFAQNDTGWVEALREAGAYVRYGLRTRATFKSYFGGQSSATVLLSEETRWSPRPL